MDLDWILEAIRSRLIVRIDYVQSNWRRIDQLEIVILGSREDDDGTDVYHAHFTIDHNKARPIVFECGNYTSETERRAFVARITNQWGSAWRCNTELVCRAGRVESRDSMIDWEALSAPNFLMLTGLLRMLGAIEEYTPEEFSGKQTFSQIRFAQEGLRNRLLSFITQRLKIMSDFQSFLRGLDTPLSDLPPSIE